MGNSFLVPGGCTGLIQPIDVGIGRPWICRLRYKLEEWMMTRDDWERIPPVTMRKLVAEWGVEAWKRIKENIVYNSWRHNPFSYFPEEPTRETTYENDYDYSDDEDDEGDDAGDDEVIATV